VKRFALIVALALLLVPLAARADEAASSVPAKAKMLAARGRAAHDAGNYNEAIAAFTQAYAMAPAPALLFNLAQAYRLQGNCDDAALMYRRFIATNPSPEVRSLAENHLATVERCMHKIALNIPVDGTPASAPGFVASAAPMRSAPASSSVSVALDRPSRKAELEKDIGIGLVIGGSTSLAIATYYAFRAHNASNDVAAAYAKGAKWKDVAPIDARGKSAATRAQLFGVGGALGVAGGVVTYLIGKHSEAPLTVATTGHGVEVGMTWAF